MKIRVNATSTADSCFHNAIRLTTPHQLQTFASINQPPDCRRKRQRQMSKSSNRIRLANSRKKTAFLFESGNT